MPLCNLPFKNCNKSIKVGFNEGLKFICIFNLFYNN